MGRAWIKGIQKHQQIRRFGGLNEKGAVGQVMGWRKKAGRRGFKNALVDRMIGCFRYRIFGMFP